MLWLLFNFFEPRIYKFSNLLYTLGMIMGFISYYYIYLLFFWGWEFLQQSLFDNTTIFFINFAYLGIQCLFLTVRI